MPHWNRSMPFKLSRTLKDRPGSAPIASTVREYEQDFTTARDGGVKAAESAEIGVSNLYYNLATDFYEYGWGRSFHFAPRVPGESFRESIVRHERNMADALDLKPGMVVADLGCGVGGPLLEIARHSGARIVGVNTNAYQLEHARRFAEEAGLTHLAEFMLCDFMNVDAPDESFDAVYSIEATIHAPDKVSVYGEAFRLLKPGGQFGVYEYCMTERFDPQDPVHVRIKANLQLGGALLVIDDRQTVDNALQTVGFQVVETRDLALQTGPSIPWYQPLAGSGLSFASFRSTAVGRWITTSTLRVLEATHLAPQGSVRVAETLNLCARAMVEAGRLGIFTPMYFVHARKPE